MRIVIATSLLVRSLLLAPFSYDQETALPGARVLFTHISPTGWCAMFGLLGLLMLWRIIDHKPRREITRTINTLVCALYTGYCMVLVTGLGYAPPELADPVVITLAAIWVTLRTDLTVNDRETA